MGAKKRVADRSTPAAVMRKRIADLEYKLTAEHARAALGDQALERERLRADNLGEDSDDATDKYQELTRKSMDLEEQLSDVLEERDALQLRVAALEGQLAQSAERQHAAAQRVTLLEARVAWIDEKRDDAEDALVAARLQIAALESQLGGAAGGSASERN